MAQDGRLEKVKVGLDTLIDNLGDGDRLALVAFDDQVQVDRAARDARSRRARSSTRSSTGSRRAARPNIYDGLEGRLRPARRATMRERQNRVIFLSDGLATAGNTATPAIIAMADGYVSAASASRRSASASTSTSS